MHGFRDDLYGDRAAAHYDDLLANFEPPPDMLALLRSLAVGGTAVEIGVGTGRVALPLAASGVRVIGVDVSAEMIDVLNGKRGSLAIEGLVADAGTFAAKEPTDLIYCVFNTIYQLCEADQQAAFLRNAAANLSERGSLVLETGILRPPEATRGMTVKRFDAGQVVLQVYSHDADRQLIEKQEVILEHGMPVQLVPSVQHYLSPEQLAEMAESCGLTLTARYGTWARDPFTPDSDTAISIFQKRCPGHT